MSNKLNKNILKEQIEQSERENSKEGQAKD